MIDVAVVGGGPVGMLMGLLLSRAGLGVRVLERRTVPVAQSRAIGIHPPALEALDAAGVGRSIAGGAVLVRRGELRHRGRVVGSLGFDGLPGRHRHIAVLPQAETERILAAALDADHPGTLVRGAEVVDLSARRGHLALKVRRDAAERTVAARWVVAADGAAGRLGPLAGIGHTGHRYPDRYLMGDLAADPGDATAVLHLGPEGIVESFPLPGGRRRWVAHLDRPLPHATAEDLVEIIARRTGTVADARTASMLSAFGVRRRIARRMTAGRLAVIGDAAHEISPIGGQGMNLGWLDAAALAPVLRRALDEPAAAPRLLAEFERYRLRAARLAAARAGVYTRLGRSAPPALSGARAAAFGVLLRTPARAWLAETFAMRRG